MSERQTGWPGFIGAALLLLAVAPLALAQNLKSGEQVYKEVCSACHANGIARAPQFGNRAAWKPLLAEGQAVVTAHGWYGVRAMPPKAGRDDLSLEEFSRAAAHMARSAGGNWQDPDAAMMSQIALEERLRRAGINARDCGPGAAASNNLRSGAQVYQQVCAACHAKGIAGAPSFGNTTAWKPLIEAGQAVLTAHAWVGVRAMPPRGGREDLGLAEFARGAAYMARAAGALWRDPDAKILTLIQDEERKRRATLAAN